MTTTKKTIKKASSKATTKSSTKGRSVQKSKVSLFWEKYPEGVIEIVDMDAILK